MQLMHLWCHSQAPCSSLSLIIILAIPPSLPLFLSLPYTPPFLPLERVSLSNSTDAHTWRDRMRHYLTQTDARSWHWGFCVRMCTHSWPPTCDDVRTHTHNSRHMPPFHHQSLQITVAHVHSVYLRLHQHSVWCKTPYIGIPAQELWLKQPPVYSRPPFRKIREGRAEERGGGQRKSEGC